MTPTPRRPRVLLAATGDADSVCRLPRLFHDAGAEVWLVCPEHFRVVKSRYVKRHIAAENDWASVLEHTRRVIASEPVEQVIMTSDRLMYEIYLSNDTEWIERYLPVRPRVAGRLIASKNEFLLACRREGVTVPPSIVCSSLTDTLNAAQSMGYPVMLKLEQGMGGLGVYCVQNAEQIKSLYAKQFMRPELIPHGELAVQRRIDGRVGTSAVYYQRGEPVYIVSAYAEQCWPTPYSPQCARRITGKGVFSDLARRIGRMTEYDGLAGIDWIEDELGTVYVLELNARPTPMHLAPCSVPSFAKALRASLHGETIPSLPQAEREGDVYPVFPADCYRVFAQRDVIGLLQWFLKFPFSSSVPWDDPPLLRVQLAELAAYWRRQAAGMATRAFARLWERLAPARKVARTRAPGQYETAILDRE